MLAHKHSRWTVLAFSALAYALVGSATGQGVDQDHDDKTTDDASGRPTYRSSVSEVRVTFFATDENNRPLDRVTQSDFAVVDNGYVVRNFRSFTHSDETALDVVALVDLSESVAPRFRAAVGNVLELVAREQSIPDDNISVVSFGGMSATTLCSSDCRARDTASRFLALRSGGSTPLYVFRRIHLA